MSSEIANLDALYAKNEKKILEDYFSYLEFPSVSSEAAHKADITACCGWVFDYLKRGGFSVERWETPGHPAIFAEWLGAGEDKPTVLFYNHYDVQPVDPIGAWTSPPFEPAIRNGEVYARGAVDNKGQSIYTIAALTTMLKERGSLPVNVKILIEGEEETGSANLPPLLKEKRDRIQADHLLIVDVGMHAPDRPSVVVGTRGILAMTVEFTGSNGDLHSGIHGGMAYNPNHALVGVLGKLRDDKGRVTVPGFYDDIAEITDEDRRSIHFHFDEDEYLRQFGAVPSGGEQGLAPLESCWLRPTLEINGVSGGYAGDGFKTVIPARAIAKISCRTVPNQDPHKIGRAVEKFITANTPHGITSKVTLHPGVGAAMRTSVHGRVVQAAAQAFSEVSGQQCKFILEGASIPVAPELAAESGAETVLIGYGLPGDQLHAPNEHFGLNRVRLGFITIGRILELMGQ